MAGYLTSHRRTLTAGGAALLALGCLGAASTPSFAAGRESSQGHENLTSVSTLSTDDSWAVGYSYAPGRGKHARTVTEHWDGSAWSVVPSPSPDRLGDRLEGVEELSATDAWAVGVDIPTSGSSSQTLIEHWDGTAWTVVADDAPADSFLSSLSATSQTDVWAVGGAGSGTLVEHWDGTAWTVVSSPSPSSSSQLLAVVAESPSDVWAAGGKVAAGDAELALLEHWDGTTWTQVAAADRRWKAGSELDGLSGTSTGDVWAVGEYFDKTAGERASLVDHWDGTKWSSVGSPPIDGSGGLSSVSADSPTDVWAIGDNTTADTTFIQRWDGHNWRVVKSPTKKRQFTEAIAALSPSSVLAVGAVRVTPFIEQWDGSHWTRLQ